MNRIIDLVVVPFHDWRKVQREGGRTRDAHMISHLRQHPMVHKTLIVNRPTSLPEIVYLRGHSRTKGKSIYRRVRCSLVEVAPNVFALDTFFSDTLGPIRQRKAWFIDAFGRDELAESIREAICYLDLKDWHLVSFNAYAGKLMPQLSPNRSLFDAWDNFLQFPRNAPFRAKLEESYSTYAHHANEWTTNAEPNSDFFSRAFGLAGCTVIRNGVDIEYFRKPRTVPDDIKSIPRPIVGLGAKVTHLLDIDLLNSVVAENPTVSFVLVGQVLDRELWRRIKRPPNFHYLGDKHYSVYPAYVQSFDVTMIPYVVGDRETGQDSIKLYEYLAAGKPVVATPVSGLLKVPGRVFPAASPEETKTAIRMALSAGQAHIDIPQDHLWINKADQMLRLLAGKLSHAVSYD